MEQSPSGEANWCKVTNLRHPPPKIKMSAMGKYIYPNIGQPPNKTFAEKKYFTINCVHFITQSMSDSLCLYQSVSLSPSPHSFMFLALIPNIPILFAAIPQRIIISPIHCVGYTAHLLKHSHSWDVLPHHCWLNTAFIFLGLWTFYKDTQFSPHMALVVWNLNTCILFCLLSLALRPNAGHGLLIFEVSWSHTTHHSR